MCWTQGNRWAMTSCSAQWFFVGLLVLLPSSTYSGNAIITEPEFRSNNSTHSSSTSGQYKNDASCESSPARSLVCQIEFTLTRLLHLTKGAGHEVFEFLQAYPPAALWASARWDDGKREDNVKY